MFCALRRLTILCAFAFHFSHADAVAQAIVRTLPRSILEQFPIENDGGPLLLPVALDGKSYFFLIDTGSPINIYDESLRSHLGPAQKRAVTANQGRGPTQLPLYSAPNAKAGRLSLKTHWPVSCVDLSTVSSFVGREVHGIIGMAFLKDHIMGIDFDKQTLSFYSSVPDQSGSLVPIFYATRTPVPFISGVIDGMGPTKFLIDTGEGGFGSGGLGAREFNLLAERGSLSALQAGTAADISGSVRTSRGELRDLELGEFQLKRLVFNRSDISSLGLNFWRRFNVIFDFPERHAYLRKGLRFNLRDQTDLSGLRLREKQGRVVVDSVAEGSAAAIAGILIYDEVAEIEGAVAHANKLHAFRLLLCSEGSIRLTLKRDGRTINKVLLLRSDHRNANSPTSDSK
jgi:hypothetical protein